VPDLICDSCGTRFWQYRGRPAKRCPPCREGTASARYGPVHRATRAATVDQAIGLPCARCQQTILPGQEIHLDHDDTDPSRWIGFSHARCNSRAGAIAGNKARAAAYRALKAGDARPVTPAGRDARPVTPNGSASLPPTTPDAASLPPEPPPDPAVCKRFREEINASPVPLPCDCGRRTSRCW
jgi:hypothetical protein